MGLVAADATKSSIHPTRKNVAFAHNVFSMRQEEFYDAARNILHRICNLQDKNPESYTYGLWPTSFEEKLCEVEFPDFNFGKSELKRYIDSYNNERISMKLKGMSPVQYRTHSQAS